MTGSVELMTTYHDQPEMSKGLRAFLKCKGKQLLITPKEPAATALSFGDGACATLAVGGAATLKLITPGARTGLSYQTGAGARLRQGAPRRHVQRQTRRSPAPRFRSDGQSRLYRTAKRSPCRRCRGDPRRAPHYQRARYRRARG